MSLTAKSILEGFEIVASDGEPVITLDNQRRFYVNTTARRLMDVKPYVRLSVGYHSGHKALAIIKPGLVMALPNLVTSNYNVDKRYYMSARHFANEYGYDPRYAPYTFEYQRAASDGSVFIFRLRE